MIKSAKGYKVGMLVRYLDSTYVIESFPTRNMVCLVFHTGSLSDPNNAKCSIDDIWCNTKKVFTNEFILVHSSFEESITDNLIECKTNKDIRKYFKDMLDRFNSNLRPGEDYRKFIKVKRKVLINGKYKFITI